MSKRQEMKSADYIDALVCGVLDILDCIDLTPQERARADEIYDSVNYLEMSIGERTQRERDKAMDQPHRGHADEPEGAA